MTWWCSATGIPWTGAWRPYPGVWLVVLALAMSYWRWGRVEPGARGRADWYIGAGVATIWLALDWPLGALAGYLVSAHTGQFILLTLVAAPLLLLGVRPRLTGSSHRVLRFAAHPLPAFAGYNLTLLVTHIPAVVDALMPTQIGSFLIDLAWLAAGVILWWPVTAPANYRRLTPPLQMGYLFIQTIPGIFPAAFLTFSSYPLYQLYELAPRVTAAITPGYDHQLAGLLMKVVGDPLVWVGIAIIFFRWANAERRADLARSRG